VPSVSSAVIAIDQGSSPLDAAASQSWSYAVVTAESSYFVLVGAGEAPEIARDVLPLCTATEIVATLNFRAWRHFLNLRLKGTTGRPHPQIVQLSKYIAKQLLVIAPCVFSEFVDATDG
jgi:thymidylate synthase (FAD)